MRVCVAHTVAYSICCRYLHFFAPSRPSSHSVHFTTGFYFSFHPSVSPLDPAPALTAYPSHSLSQPHPATRQPNGADEERPLGSGKRPKKKLGLTGAETSGSGHRGGGASGPVQTRWGVCPPESLCVLPPPFLLRVRVGSRLGFNQRTQIQRRGRCVRAVRCVGISLCAPNESRTRGVCVLLA